LNALSGVADTSVLVVVITTGVALTARLLGRGVGIGQQQLSRPDRASMLAV